MASVAALLVPLMGAASSVPPPDPTSRGKCLGEYAWCNQTGSCTLSDCTSCSAGEYRCPLPDTSHTPPRAICVEGAAGYLACPHMKGTHLDWTLSLEERLSYLVGATTLEEQAAQLQADAAPALERLGIPAYNWLNDDVHGVANSDGTIFPNGVSLGMSWDRELLYEVGRAIGTEARGSHNGFVHDDERGTGDMWAYNGMGITMYAPNMNLVRDPRWGRAQEVYSEDPELTGELSAKFVQGAQGATMEGVPEQKELLTVACCKHLAGYDLENFEVGTPPNNGVVDRVRFDANITSRNLWEFYLPAFETCLKDGKAGSVMCSFNSINGVPSCANGPLMNGVLRKRWQWDGFIMSDYDAWANLVQPQMFADNYTQAAAMGLNAGMDQEGGGTKAIEQLAAAVKAKLTTAEHVATAFRRLFAARIKLGMLDPPQAVRYNNVSFDVCASSPHIALARKAAQKAIALHQNRGGVLPLDPRTLSVGGSLALIGPTSDNANNMLGNYAAASTAGPGMAVSILTGLQSFESNGAKIGKVSHAAGCDDVNCTSTAGFAQAVALSKHPKCKATILVLGTRVSGDNKQDPAGPCHSNVACEGEAHDRNSTLFGGYQYKLAEALKQSQTGVPLICVFVHGGAMTLGNLRESCDGILDVGFPGSQGGNGLADVLFGEVSPAGRAATTWYLNDNDLPAAGEMDLYSGKGLTYRHYDSSVAPIAFGSGLSYTTFSYSNLKINATSVTHCEAFAVTVDVTNTGKVDSDEVVQLYVSTPHATVPAPKVRLADFTRVHIHAGTMATVTLTVNPEAHSVVLENVAGSDPKFWEPTVAVEAGSISVYVGGSQPNIGVETLAGNVTISKGGMLGDCSQ